MNKDQGEKPSTPRPVPPLIVIPPQDPDLINYVEEGVKPSPDDVPRIIQEAPPSRLVKGVPEQHDAEDEGD